MIRKIVQIDEDLCNGCGDCAEACHEGAIVMIDGKAKLVKDDYCDGLGDCLPACPTGAIEIIEREAKPFDAEAVKARQNQLRETIDSSGSGESAFVCPGRGVASFDRGDNPATAPSSVPKPQSQLRQWPVQIKLVPVQAPFFDGAKLLIAADCTAFAYADFHEDFIKNHITIIGCPKLDDGDYTEKLTEIIKLNDIKSVTIVRMQVPCCSGLEAAVKRALQASGKFIPWQVVVISGRGEIIE